MKTTPPGCSEKDSNTSCVLEMKDKGLKWLVSLYRSTDQCSYPEENSWYFFIGMILGRANVRVTYYLIDINLQGHKFIRN